MSKDHTPQGRRNVVYFDGPKFVWLKSTKSDKSVKFVKLGKASTVQYLVSEKKDQINLILQPREGLYLIWWLKLLKKYLFNVKGQKKVKKHLKSVVGLLHFTK